MADEFNRFLKRTVAQHRTEDPDWAAYFAERDHDETAELKRKLEAEAQPHHVITPGHEIPVDSVVKRTKGGRYSTQSIAGKVATLIEELGGTVKAGESVYYSGDRVTESIVDQDGTKSKQLTFKPGEQKTHQWVAAMCNGHYVEVVGSTIFLDRSRIVKMDELIEAL